MPGGRSELPTVWTLTERHGPGRLLLSCNTCDLPTHLARLRNAADRLTVLPYRALPVRRISRALGTLRLKTGSALSTTGEVGTNGSGPLELALIIARRGHPGELAL